MGVKVFLHLFLVRKDADEGKGLTSKNQEQDNIQLGRREDSRRTEDSFRESEQVRHDIPLRDSEEDTGNTNRKHGVHVVSATDKSVNGWESIIKVNQFSTNILIMHYEWQLCYDNVLYFCYIEFPCNF